MAAAAEAASLSTCTWVGGAGWAAGQNCGIMKAAARRVRAPAGDTSVLRAGNQSREPQPSRFRMWVAELHW
eukprot:scaffold27928_cov115-Isochrysis_galbana.AAC.2